MTAAAGRGSIVEGEFVFTADDFSLSGATYTECPNCKVPHHLASFGRANYPSGTAVARDEATQIRKVAN